jgi:hypothetical protein
MPLLARILASVFLLLIVGFCVLGFMATFEPLHPRKQLTWRITYGTVGGASMLAVLWLLRPRRKRS